MSKELDNKTAGRSPRESRVIPAGVPGSARTRGWFSISRLFFFIRRNRYFVSVSFAVVAVFLGYTLTSYYTSIDKNREANEILYDLKKGLSSGMADKELGVLEDKLKSTSSSLYDLYLYSKAADIIKKGKDVDQALLALEVVGNSEVPFLRDLARYQLATYKKDMVLLSNLESSSVFGDNFKNLIRLQQAYMFIYNNNVVAAREKLDKVIATSDKGSPVYLAASRMRHYGILRERKDLKPN